MDVHQKKHQHYPTEGSEVKYKVKIVNEQRARVAKVPQLLVQYLIIYFDFTLT